MSVEGPMVHTIFVIVSPLSVQTSVAALAKDLMAIAAGDDDGRMSAVVLVAARRSIVRNRGCECAFLIVFVVG